MTSTICQECSRTFNFSKSNAVYCLKCFNQRKYDLCELITPKGYGIITGENIGKFLTLLDVKNDIKVRLDLHGVLDTIPQSTQFENPENICCISFVGSTTQTRINARKEIANRLGHQINFGILVFARGRGRDKNCFHDMASKAWINSKLPTGSKAVFVDDSGDHYLSTQSMQIPKLDCHFFQPFENLHKIINKYNSY